VIEVHKVQKDNKVLKDIKELKLLKDNKVPGAGGMHRLVRWTTVVW
jgi:hypothetical protein